MSGPRCPFCKCDPYHYVDIGVGYQAVAINCCEPGIALYQGDKRAKKILQLRRSHSPRKKARAARILAVFE